MLLNKFYLLRENIASKKNIFKFKALPCQKYTNNDKNKLGYNTHMYVCNTHLKIKEIPRNN